MKTLNDLKPDVVEEDGTLGSETGFSEELLKETAIECIKEYKEGRLLGPSLFGLSPKEVRDYGNATVITFIKRFFNITNEDLERESL